MTETDTKHKLLDAAEQIFAVKGFSAASLRAITAEAGVNLAAVNYHFGSKEELARAVFQRRLDPVNHERLHHLATLTERNGDNPIPLDDLIHAFVAPALTRFSVEGKGETLRSLHARIHAEPDDRWSEMFMDLFRPVAQGFGAALSRTLPHLSRQELIHRMHFLIGTLVHTLGEARKLRNITGEGAADCAPAQLELYIEAFVNAGLAAPAAPVLPATPAATDDEVTHDI